MLFSTHRGLQMRRVVAATFAMVMVFGSASGYGRGRLGGGAAGALDDMDLLPPNQTTTGLPSNLVNGFAPVGSVPGDGTAGVGGIPLVIPGQNGAISQSGQAVTLLPGSVNGNGGRPAGVARQLGPDGLPFMRSLKAVAVPPVPGIVNFIRDRQAAIVLGKALFWDAQAGSDGNACASCHFHAGADNRMKNQLSPGLNAGDQTFQATGNSVGAPNGMDKPGHHLAMGERTTLDLFTSPHDRLRSDARLNKPTSAGAGGPNYTLKPGDFPFHQLSDPLDRNSTVLFDSNDVVSSQGAFGGAFKSLGAKGTEVCGDRTKSDTFQIKGILTRRVPGRNAPTTINAVFNYRNFWDGRANNIFNGVNPFGPRDPDAKVLQLLPDGSTNWTTIALPNASLASQAVGPALSEFEMSCAGRTFKDLGRKLLSLQPLRLQDVHPGDSVLGLHATPNGRGLRESYPDLIRAAFDPRWWSAAGQLNGYTQMENNFSLFWGLAVMMYESTLVSDETPFDKFIGYPGSLGDVNALTAQQQHGLTVFRGNGQCVSCHKGAEFTGAATALQPGGDEGTVIESMFLKTGELAIYDNGFYNIGVRPTAEDRGVGGTDPFGNPLSFTRNWFELLRKQPVMDPVWVDPCLFSIFTDANACWIAPEPDGTRVVTDGAFKTPTLRNIALTQPYFHNGSRYTLEQVVEFYNRGGDRRGPDDNDTTGFVAPDATNGGTTNLHPAINPLGLTQLERTDLVAFLRFALTDPRVACERAPFDHPSLSLHDGHVGNENRVSDSNRDGMADDLYLRLPAVGAMGLPTEKCLRNDDGSTIAGLPSLARPDWSMASDWPGRTATTNATNNSGTKLPPRTRIDTNMKNSSASVPGAAATGTPATSTIAPIVTTPNTTAPGASISTVAVPVVSNPNVAVPNPILQPPAASNVTTQSISAPSVTNSSVSTPSATAPNTTAPGASISTVAVPVVSNPNVVVPNPTVQTPAASNVPTQRVSAPSVSTSSTAKPGVLADGATTTNSGSGLNVEPAVHSDSAAERNNNTEGVSPAERTSISPQFIVEESSANVSRSTERELTTTDAPVASTGLSIDAPSSAKAGGTITMTGSVSEGTTFRWTQIAGPTVDLQGGNTLSPSFTVPAGPTNLEFRLTATNAVGASLTTSQRITVVPDDVSARIVANLHGNNTLDVVAISSAIRANTSMQSEGLAMTVMFWNNKIAAGRPGSASKPITAHMKLINDMLNMPRVCANELPCFEADLPMLVANSKALAGTPVFVRPNKVVITSSLGGSASPRVSDSSRNLRVAAP